MCPADACRIDDAFCPAGEEVENPPMFEIIEEGINKDQIANYEKFLKNSGVDVAGIEFIRDINGEIYTYDVNTDTNYNSEAEEKADKYGMLELAKFLGSALDESLIKS